MSQLRADRIFAAAGARQRAVRASACFALLALLLAGASWAAEPPVTRGEVVATRVRAEAILRRVLELPAAPLAPVAEADRAATRSDVVRELMVLVRLAEPKFVFTPRPARWDAGRVIRLPEAADHASLERLLRWGLAPPYHALVTQEAGLQPEAFGDLVGYFLARLADLTHTPSAEFSPGLMRD